jgi:hypothetical protein
LPPPTISIFKLFVFRKIGYKLFLSIKHRYAINVSE